jgi:hypothetical protein
MLVLACCTNVQAQALPDLTERVDDSAGDLTESVEPASGDVTESITASSPAASAPAEEPEIGVAKFSGWAKETLEWSLLQGSGAGRGAPDPYAVRRDQLTSRTQLVMRASYRLGDHFEANLSGLLDVWLREQAAPSGVVFNGINGASVLSSAEPDLREAYLGFYSSRFDLRIGQQRVAWGRADLFSPNDVLNARDLRTPFLIEPELRTLPTPLLRADGYFGALSLQAIVTPFFVPDRFTLFGTNWSATQLDTPAPYRGFLNLARRSLDTTLESELNQVLQQTRHPGAGEISFGFKAALSLASLDLGAYYHYGFDSTPFVSIQPSFAFLLQQTDFSNARLDSLTPVLRAVDAGIAPFRAEYLRRHHVGLDAAAGVGPFMLRLDAAYQTQRVFYTRELVSYASPALLITAGAELQTGEIDRTLLIEVFYVGLLQGVPPPLLGYAPRTLGVASLFRWPLFAVFSFEARVLGTFIPRSYVVQPGIVTALGGATLKVSALVLGGDAWSVGWVYRRNTAAVAELRYAF